MPNRTQSYRTTTLTNAAESGNNTETVVCTLNGISTEFDGQTVRIRGWLKASVGTGTTAGLMRIRRDSLTGTSISEATAETGPFVASKVCDGTVEVDDTSRTLAGATYVLTYQGTGDTAVTTFLAGALKAETF
jgi:hypothetical protein